jgi:hypothetical protein
MNLEHVFESILRIYPKSFRDRFGEELQLGFRDDLNTNPSKLELLKLIGDTFTAAVWERLQASRWLYWFCAVVTVFFYVASAITVFFPETNGQINAILNLPGLFFAVACPLAFLLRLERVPSRLEWAGLILSFNPMTLFFAGSTSIELAVWFTYVSCLGLGFFAISNQWTRGILIPAILA